MATLGFSDPGDSLAAATPPPRPGEVEASVGTLAMCGRRPSYGTVAASSAYSSPGSRGGHGLQLHTRKEYIVYGIPNPYASEPYLGLPIYLPGPADWDATIDQDREPPDRQYTSERRFPKKSIPAMLSLTVLLLAILPVAANV